MTGLRRRARAVRRGALAASRGGRRRRRRRRGGAGQRVRRVQARVRGASAFRRHRESESTHTHTHTTAATATADPTGRRARPPAVTCRGSDARSPSRRATLPSPFSFSRRSCSPTLHYITPHFIVFTVIFIFILFLFLYYIFPSRGARARQHYITAHFPSPFSLLPSPSSLLPSPFSLLPSPLPLLSSSPQSSTRPSACCCG